LQITSIISFFAMMAVFVGLGFLISRVLPPYRFLGLQLLAKKGYYVELESMRGVLALCVVIHHAVVWYFLLYRNTSNISGPNAGFYSQLGTAPVTFFFFITSFLFWSKLISTPKLPFGPFLYARLRRLGPAYLGGAAFVFVLVAIFTHFQLLASPAAVARDMLRVLLADTPKLNGLNSAPWLWGVTWTLRFEFLFYLLIPFLGWFAQTLSKTLLFVVGCNLLYAASLFVHADHWHPPGFFQLQALDRFLSFTFCVGMLTAHVVRMRRIRAFAHSLWAAPLSLLLIAAGLCFLPAQHGPLESLCFAIPFVAVACGCNFWGALRSRALLFLGQISYSVYLIHCLVYGAILLPLYGVFGYALQNPRLYWAIIFLSAPVIIAVATLWHRCLELPFLPKKRAVSAPQPPVLATLEVACAPVSK